MSNDVNELLSDWVESERTGDLEKLDAMLSDDFVGIGPVGFVLDKQAWLNRFGMGLRYDHLELDEVATHRHGDTAFVVAHQRARGNAGPNPTPSDLRVSFTVVAHDDATPRIAGLQYSFIGMPEPAR